LNGTPDSSIIELEGTIRQLGIKEDIRESLLHVLNESQAKNILNSQDTPITNESYHNNHIGNHIVNSGNNNNNNVNQNIVVNKFGKDDWTHVTNMNMFDMLKHPMTMIVEAF